MALWPGGSPRGHEDRTVAGEAAVSGEPGMSGCRVLGSYSRRGPETHHVQHPHLPDKGAEAQRGRGLLKGTRLGFKPGLRMPFALPPREVMGAEAVVCPQVRCSSCSGARRKAKQPRRCQMCSGSGRRRYEWVPRLRGEMLSLMGFRAFHCLPSGGQADAQSVLSLLCPHSCAY